VVAGPLPISILDHEDTWREGPEFVALVPTADGEPEAARPGERAG
jgi:hypothetical protein